MLKLGTKGRTAEDRALKFLKKNGLKLLQRNYHCRLGEIDLVMADSNYTVFVEVRYRSSSHFGGAIHSINSSKQAKLRLAAQHYLLNNSSEAKGHDTPCRFDIISMTGVLSNPEIEWLKNAI